MARDGMELFAEAWEATGPVERMRGLIGTDGIAEGTCMAFARCPRIHCKGMRYPIDVLTLDRSGRVLDARRVDPGEMGPRAKGAWWAVECAAGTAERLGIEPGQTIEVTRGGSRA